MATPPQVDIEVLVRTAGTVAVGGTATGEITPTTDPNARDHDWFAVSLEAGKTYRVDIRGHDTRDGSLDNPVLAGLYDASGTFVAGTGDDNSGVGRNSLTVFTPETAGTYYVATRAHGADIGTYTVAVAELAGRLFVIDRDCGHGDGGRHGHRRDRPDRRPECARP